MPGLAPPPGPGNGLPGRPVRASPAPLPMRAPLLAALAVSLAACGPAGEPRSTAGPVDDALAAAPAAGAGTASGPTTYDCASGETITLDRTDGELRYTLGGQTVVLAAEGEGRYAAEAMWVVYQPDGRVTVTRDEDTPLDCTAR